MLINNVGLFGGAFDPVHNGHIHIVDECLQKLNLHKVIIMPTGKSAFNKKLTASEYRFEMLKKTFKNKKFEVSEFEIDNSKKNKPSYTIDTVKHLNPNTNIRLFLIMGEDALLNFEKWHKWNEITKYCHLIIINRKSNQLDKKKFNPQVLSFIENNLEKNIEMLNLKSHGAIFFLKIKPIDISSETIREKIKKNENIDKKVPKVIVDYIKNKSLYLNSGKLK